MNTKAPRLLLQESPRPRLLGWIEALAVFALGVAFMNFLYASSAARPGAEIGVPEYDSYYHIAMAMLLPEHGLMAKFPWLEFVYFRDQGDDFVSHHTGFHLLLLPFVKAAEWLVGDPLAGGRWAMSAFFGANLMLFNLLLRHRRAPLHWLWIALFLLLPDQFFARHGYVRAMGPSLMFIQLTLLALFAKRYWTTALILTGYVHLYLGAVLYGPVIVATFAVVQLFGPKADREVPWKLALITAGGWLLGVVSYPYSAGMFEFLKMQVFGTGLTPDIEVGREWLPYTDAWFPVTMAGPLLGVWVMALVLRLRMGPALERREITLVVLQFLFLLLTLKARRFIEYWPPLCLLSAAYLATPPLEAAGIWARSRLGRAPALGAATIGVGLVALAGICLTAWGWALKTPAATELLTEWRIWAALSALLALPALVRALIPRDQSGLRPARGLALAACGVCIVGGIALAAGSVSAELSPRMHVPGIGWSLLVVAYGLIPLFISARSPMNSTRTPTFARAAGVVLLALLAPAALMLAGARTFESASDQLRCYFNLEDTRELMDFLKRDSREGDIVFTDDWDVFPLFFYHNQHNRYIVGLDPKFTQQRQPDLWRRYVKISRGEVPGAIRLASTESQAQLAPVGLEDIREQFHARYVVTDRDHRRLADALARAPHLAEFAWPGARYEEAREAPYVVFRIRERDIAAPPPGAVRTGPVYLSDLRPISASQGWGELGHDRSVEGAPIRLAGETYMRGVGTHAPAKLLYEVPAGYDVFEAVVGVDDETDGRGSVVVSIELDGRLVYESPELRGGGRPAVIRMPIRGARQLQLSASETADGQRFDHVCWADARFVEDEEGALQRVAKNDGPASTATP